MVEFTADTLFDGRITVFQPQNGYRFSLDAVLLAAHVTPVPESRVMDIGCGCGIIPLLLGCRHPCIHITGVEIQAELACLARKNAVENHLEDRVRIMQADIRHIRRKDSDGPMDVILSNPPYKKRGAGRLNPDMQKAVARHELKLDVNTLLTRAHDLLRPHGTLCLIFPASRLPELMAAMAGHGFAPQWLRAVHPRPDAPAKRVLISGIRDGHNGCSIRPALYLYDRAGKPTNEHRALFNA